MGTYRVNYLDVLNNATANNINTGTIYVNSIQDNGGILGIVDDLQITGNVTNNVNFTAAGGVKINRVTSILGVLQLLGNGDAVTTGICTPPAHSSDDFHICGDFSVTGSGKSCLLKGTDGKGYVYFCVESPEIRFTDTFSSSLDNGVKEIKLDKRFIATTTINEFHPMQVSVTPCGKCNGLWVEKFLDRVIVHELNDGKSNVPFDITISAKKVGCEDMRFDEMVNDETTGRYYQKSKEKLYFEKKPVLLNRDKKAKEIELVLKKFNDLKKELIKDNGNSKIKKQIIDTKTLLKSKEKDFVDMSNEIKLIEGKYKYKYSWDSSCNLN
jgi:hypothetical protein